MSVALNRSHVLEHFGKIENWNMEYGTVYEGSIVALKIALKLFSLERAKFVLLSKNGSD